MDDRYYEIPEGDGLTRRIRNPLEEAIHDVLGGAVPAAEALGVTRQNVHYLLSTKRLRDRDVAVKLADATREKGREVPAVELLNLTEWRGPERSGPNGRKRRGPNGSSPRLVTSGKPAGGGTEAGARARLQMRGTKRTGRGASQRPPVKPGPISGIYRGLSAPARIGQLAEAS